MLTCRATKSRLVYPDWMISQAIHHSVKTSCYSSVFLAAIWMYWCVCVSACLCTRWQGCTCAQKCDFGLNEMRDDEGEGVWMSTQEALSHSNVVSSLGNETSGTGVVCWPWLTGFTHLFSQSQTGKSVSLSAGLVLLEIVLIRQMCNYLNNPHVCVILVE